MNAWDVTNLDKLATYLAENWKLYEDLAEETQDPNMFAVYDEKASTYNHILGVVQNLIEGATK